MSTRLIKITPKVSWNRTDITLIKEFSQPKDNMIFNTQLIQQKHVDMVRSLSKPGANILQELTPDQAHLWHMATGLAGEAAEVLDAVKKLVVYQKPLNGAALEHLKEELGDVEFYLEGVRQALCLDRDGILAANVAKLAKRYKDFQYTNDQAIARADKEATQ